MTPQFRADLNQAQAAKARYQQGEGAGTYNYPEKFFPL